MLKLHATVGRGTPWAKLKAREVRPKLGACAVALDGGGEGATTTAQEENRKEEVLWVFRELVRDSKRKEKVHEYVPWEPRWR